MDAPEIAKLRKHYLAEMVKRVAEVEGLNVVVGEAEAEVEARIDPNTVQDPMYVVDQYLRTNFAYRKNVTRRDRLREEGKMFALAAEALRP